MFECVVGGVYVGEFLGGMKGSRIDELKLLLVWMMWVLVLCVCVWSGNGSIRFGLGCGMLVLVIISCSVLLVVKCIENG